MKKVLFTATVDSHILHFHIPYLKLFKDNGYEVHVATNGNEEIPYCDVKHLISFERNPFKTNNIKAIKYLKKIIDKENFEIIHTHTPMGSVVTRLAAKKARKKLGTRVIYTAHGFHFYKGAPIINWLLFYPIEKCLSRITDDLITINKEDYELAKKKFKAKNIHYIPGVGIDPEKFNFEMSEEEKLELRKSLGLKQDDFVMIYVAELNKNKNQKMLIETMKELVKEDNNIKLLLVGKDSYNGKYQILVKDYKLENNIKFLGYRKDIVKLLKISNLAVSTSKREGLPVNLLEAMYVGLPIIATNCRGNRDLVKNGKNGYIVEINDIKNIITNINILRHLKHTTFYNSDFSYNQESILKKVERIYNIKYYSKPIRVLQMVKAMDMGGAETFIMNLYRNIDRDKVQFDFLLSREGYFDDEIKSLGGRIYYIPYLTDKGQFMYIRNLKKFFYLHREYKIVHSHIDQVSGIILETAKKCNVPVRIAHSHSTKNSNGLLGKIYKIYLQNKINKNATKLLACSEEAAKWLFRKKSADAIIINNGIDIEKFKFSQDKRNKIRNELNIPEDYVVIGHIGAFRKEKNHDFLIDVYNEYLKENPKTYLVMVGDGVLKKEVEEKVAKFGIKNNVKFLGIRNDTDCLYSAFDCFCFPSFYEGLGIVLIEAQIANLHCIVSDNIPNLSKITDLIEYLPLNNLHEWVKKIKVTYGERFNMDNNKLKDDFDINKIVCILQSIYEEEKNI